MFDEKNQPVDIFADVDKVVDRGPQGPVIAAPEPPVTRSGPSKLIFVIVLLLIGGLGYGGFWFFKKSKTPTAGMPKENAMTAEASGTNTAAPAPTNVAAPVAKIPVTPTPPANVPPAPINSAPPQPTEPVQPPDAAQAPPDADADRLSDAEEGTLGTNPQSSDTDSDGLSDFDEVKLYKTDPKNPDTDGDTFLDGQEVKNGYNPKGDGKLFQVPK